MTRDKSYIWVGLSIGMAGLMLLLLFTHTYNDIVVTTRHGMNFWDILFSGNILNFYRINVTESGNIYYSVLQSCAYNILVYVVFAVWNIPLVLLEKFIGLDVMNNMFCLAYSKGLLIAAMLYSAYLLEKVLEHMEIYEEKKKFFVFLYMTSTVMVSVLFITSQYDILSVVLQLLGVKAFLERKDKQFFFWFGIAVCFKFFALIIFVPLLVLRYKKVLNWLVGTGIIMAFPIITKVPFWFATAAPIGASEGESFELTMIQMLIRYSRKELNVFVLLYVFIVVWCFFQSKYDDHKMHVRKTIWAAFVSYAAFFGLMEVYPYWSILMTPYVVLVIAISCRSMYANVLLETCGMAALTVANIIKYDWCYFGDTMKSMLMASILNTVPSTDGYIYTAIMTMLEMNMFPLINSIFIACMCAIAYLAYPNGTKRRVEENMNPEGCMDVVVIRCMVTAVICLLPILSLFI